MKTKRFLAAFAAVLVPFALASAFELEASKPAKTFTRPKAEGPITCLAYDAKGEYITATGEKTTVQVWEVASEEQKERVVHGPPMGKVFVSCVAAYPKAPIMVHCSEFGIKFNLIGRHGKIPTLDIKLKGTCWWLDFSSDGDHLATADKTGEVAVWDLWTNENIRRFEPVKKLVNALRYHPDGNRIAAACGDGKCKVWDVKENKLLYEVDGDGQSCGTVDWSADGKWLATGGKDKKIHIFSAEDGKVGPVLEGHENTIEQVAFHPDKGSAILASCADDKTVRLWDTTEKKEVQKIAHDAEVASISWRPDGKALATGAGDKVQVFEVKKDK